MSKTGVNILVLVAYLNDDVHHSRSVCLQHAVDCGGGVGIYLLVLSTQTVVIRGPRAAVWGSLYLDEHGEEDRDLK